eukprot:8352-Prymnesium_polylepis.1
MRAQHLRVTLPHARAIDELDRQVLGRVPQEARVLDRVVRLGPQVGQLEPRPLREGGQLRVGQLWATTRR